MEKVAETVATRAIIDLDAVCHNYRVIRKAVDRRVKILAVVKSDAYGHGLVDVARVLEREGADMLGVGCVHEGARLRAAGVAIPVMVLSVVPEPAIPEAIESDLTLTLASVQAAQPLATIASAKGRVAKVHCIIDTGMGRIGFRPEAAADEIPVVLQYSSIDIEGIYTHFPRATTERDPFTANQVKVFKNVIKSLEDSGVPFEMTHAANSAAVVNYPSAQFDMVRVGIMLYGVAPTKALQGRLDLRPAMRFETTVVFVKSVPESTPLSYEHTYATPNATTIATLPVGYAHGYDFLLSNAGEVLARGQRAPIVGRVCMDQTLVNVGRVPGVCVGDEVTLIGRDGNQTITAEDIAERAHTIPYDILLRVGKMAPREYVGARDTRSG